MTKSVLTAAIRIAWITAALMPGLAATAAAQGDRPANLCAELAAFLHPPAQDQATGTPPPQAATAVQAPAQDKPVPKPADSGAPQKESGQSGPIPNAGPGASGPQGESQKDSQAAPKAEARAGPKAETKPETKPEAKPETKPAGAPAAPRPDPDSVSRADQAAASNDLRGCRDVAQSLRRSGVAMPAPLLALAAMDLKFLEAAEAP
ncbi:hypothetical protein [Methylobacterium oxalidis]|uniref:Uncharacterized protein n=1 Tax=Methylobacterium oxalidis TaxID=944322 RepID=A0A512IX49_9HYPH|nr:hypothetical protein [Methylobacterium oxalidis]GEP02233.1 hypothetical protein MOX02_02710 [Methylobacterium oxalidis]GJE32225.1 hypothetical protein LDDCCGHA_2409 [Methylobacterium oxalidis]GLS62178.1 hypothetical protein GCM10007888_05590 [Methylobacterium oxalidis]